MRALFTPRPMNAARRRVQAMKAARAREGGVGDNDTLQPPPSLPDDPLDAMRDPYREFRVSLKGVGVLLALAAVCFVAMFLLGDAGT
ncbi:hypothetical protein SAMN05428948_1122 [Massilia sp. CF038]|nr:hypothetical protein SAMN05428948_1122 [Massilia sp. CF038]